MQLLETAPESPGHRTHEYGRRRVRDGAVVVGSMAVAAGCVWLGAHQPEHRLLLAWAGFWSAVVALWAIYLFRAARRPWSLRILFDGLCVRIREGESGFLWIAGNEIESIGLVKERRVFFQREERMTTRHPCLEVRLVPNTEGVDELTEVLESERAKRRNSSLFHHPPVMVDSRARVRIDLRELEGGSEAVFRALIEYHRLPDRHLVVDMTARQDDPEDHILRILRDEGTVRARILARKIYRMKDTEIRDLLKS